jgi:O-antigen/teichoic acid export membrane protein
MIARLKSVNFFNSFMKYLKKTSWFFGEKILLVILGFIVGVWVVRYLGPA